MPKKAKISVSKKSDDEKQDSSKTRQKSKDKDVRQPEEARTSQDDSGKKARPGEAKKVNGRKDVTMKANPKKEAKNVSKSNNMKKIEPLKDPVELAEGQSVTHLVQKLYITRQALKPVIDDIIQRACCVVTGCCKNRCVCSSDVYPTEHASCENKELHPRKDICDCAKAYCPCVSKNTIPKPAAPPTADVQKSLEVLNHFEALKGSDSKKKKAAKKYFHVRSSKDLINQLEALRNLIRLTIETLKAEQPGPVVVRKTIKTCDIPGRASLDYNANDGIPNNLAELKEEYEKLCRNIQHLKYHASESSSKVKSAASMPQVTLAGAKELILDCFDEIFQFKDILEEQAGVDTLSSVNKSYHVSRQSKSDKRNGGIVLSNAGRVRSMSPDAGATLASQDPTRSLSSFLMEQLEQSEDHRKDKERPIDSPLDNAPSSESQQGPSRSLGSFLMEQPGQSEDDRKDRKRLIDSSLDNAPSSESQQGPAAASQNRDNEPVQGAAASLQEQRNGKQDDVSLPSFNSVSDYEFYSFAQESEDMANPYFPSEASLPIIDRHTYPQEYSGTSVTVDWLSSSAAPCKPSTASMPGSEREPSEVVIGYVTLKPSSGVPYKPSDSSLPHLNDDSSNNLTVFGKPNSRECSLLPQKVKQADAPVYVVEASSSPGALQRRYSCGVPYEPSASSIPVQVNQKDSERYATIVRKRSVGIPYEPSIGSIPPSNYTFKNTAVEPRKSVKNHSNQNLNLTADAPNETASLINKNVNTNSNDKQCHKINYLILSSFSTKVKDNRPTDNKSHPCIKPPAYELRRVKTWKFRSKNLEKMKRNVNVPEHRRNRRDINGNVSQRKSKSCPGIITHHIEMNEQDCNITQTTKEKLWSKDTCKLSILKEILEHQSIQNNPIVMTFTNANSEDNNTRQLSETERMPRNLKELIALIQMVQHDENQHTCPICHIANPNFSPAESRQYVAPGTHPSEHLAPVSSGSRVTWRPGHQLDSSNLDSMLSVDEQFNVSEPAGYQTFAERPRATGAAVEQSGIVTGPPSRIPQAPAIISEPPSMISQVSSLIFQTPSRIAEKTSIIAPTPSRLNQVSSGVLHGSPRILQIPSRAGISDSRIFQVPSRAGISESKIFQDSSVPVEKEFASKLARGQDACYCRAQHPNQYRKLAVASVTLQQPLSNSRDQPSISPSELPQSAVDQPVADAVSSQTAFTSKSPSRGTPSVTPQVSQHSAGSTKTASTSKSPSRGTPSVTPQVSHHSAGSTKTASISKSPSRGTPSVTSQVSQHSAGSTKTASTSKSPSRGTPSVTPQVSHHSAGSTKTASTSKSPSRGTPSVTSQVSQHSTNIAVTQSVASQNTAGVSSSDGSQPMFQGAQDTVYFVSANSNLYMSQALARMVREPIFEGNESYDSFVQGDQSQELDSSSSQVYVQREYNNYFQGDSNPEVRITSSDEASQRCQHYDESFHKKEEEEYVMSLYKKQNYGSNYSRDQNIQVSSRRDRNCEEAIQRDTCITDSVENTSSVSDADKKSSLTSNIQALVSGQTRTSSREFILYQVDTSSNGNTFQQLAETRTLPRLPFQIQNQTVYAMENNKEEYGNDFVSRAVDAVLPICHCRDSDEMGVFVPVACESVIKDRRGFCYPESCPCNCLNTQEEAPSPQIVVESQNMPAVETLKYLDVQPGPCTCVPEKPPVDKIESIMSANATYSEEEEEEEMVILPESDKLDALMEAAADTRPCEKSGMPVTVMRGGECCPCKAGLPTPQRTTFLKNAAARGDRVMPIDQPCAAMSQEVVTRSGYVQDVIGSGLVGTEPSETSNLEKVLWALARVSIFDDGTRTFEILEASPIPPGHYFLPEPDEE